jgi:hypothetical protein
VVLIPEESKASCKANWKSVVTGGGGWDPPRQTTRQGGGTEGWDWYFENLEDEEEDGIDDKIAAMAVIM